METLSRWIDADQAGWIGTVRMASGATAKSDPLFGWRPRVVQFLRPNPPNEKQLTHQAMAKLPPDPGMTTVAMAKRAGTFRVNRLRDGFIDFRKFTKTDHYQHFYVAKGVTDRIWVGLPAATDAESFFCFDRRHRKTQFTATHAELAGHTLRGLTWFHRQLLMANGLTLVQSPLTPTEQRILRHLLTEKSEKEIAAAMQLSKHTVHDHITQILRKYGVSGRTALMALWLARGV